MYAFVDETGNTGANLFDPDQPDFFTGALITKTDFDKVHGPAIRALCSRSGLPAVHASVIGFGPVEAVAPDLRRILKATDARFFVSRVEKRYLLATKVFDTFFDSGENPAVPWTAYNIRVLRLILCFKVASLLDDVLARRFWAMLMAKREKAARAMIPGICEAFLERVDFLPDERSRSIVREAFAWSKEHPEALDIFISGRQAKNGHMPNLVAFTNLLAGLEELSKRWDRPLRRIVHDRQAQFEATLAEWHQLFSNAADVPVHWLGENYTLRMVPGSTFEVSASEASPGIQVADLILWLYRQWLARKPLPPHSAKLLRHALKRAWQSDFSFEGVGRLVERRMADIMEADIPETTMAEGQRLLQETERRRREAMDLYELDGLMPYQRQPPVLIDDDGGEK